MVRKLKVYTTSIGFFDLAVAAPSMKAASEAWGSDPEIFRRGFARQTEDPAIVECAMAKPGIVLRRPVGSKSAFKEHAVLPKGLDAGPAPPKPPPKSAWKATRDAAQDRAAALAYEKEQARREAERRKEEAKRKREEERRERARAKADAELERARKQHEERVAAIEERRRELEAEADAAEREWDTARDRHRKAVNRAES